MRVLLNFLFQWLFSNFYKSMKKIYPGKFQKNLIFKILKILAKIFLVIFRNFSFPNNFIIILHKNCLYKFSQTLHEMNIFSNWSLVGKILLLTYLPTILVLLQMMKRSWSAKRSRNITSIMNRYQRKHFPI